MKAKLLLIAFAGLFALGCNHFTNPDIVGDNTTDIVTDDDNIDENDNSGQDSEIEEDLDSDLDNENGDENPAGNTNNENDPDNGEDINDSEGEDGYNTIPLLTSTGEVNDYLAAQTGGGSAAKPISLSLQIDLELTTSSSSNWQSLLSVLSANGKYVKLDLSACSMNGTEFNPVNTVKIGKNLIVSIILPDTAETIKAGASIAAGTFRYFTALASIRGAGITIVDKYAFPDAVNLKSVDFPCLEYIGTSAFRNCTSLTAVTIPSGVTTIGTNAFINCANLLTLTINAVSPPVLKSGGLDGTPQTMQILVPPGSIDAYKTAANWKKYADRIIER